MSPPKQKTFMDEWPNWVRMVTQLGFAGLVGWLFYLDNVSRLDEARIDREMFRQELKAQREELSAAVKEMKAAVDAMNKCKVAPNP